jgi:hypothetical protein
VAGNTAAVKEGVTFLYGLMFSDPATWGGEVPPRQGDTIYVPAGMTLIVDESTDVLKAVIVEGRITWSDDKDMTFDAMYIIVRGGAFQVGTEAAPYQNQLIITMHGNYQDSQLPEFGSKVIGCHHCTMDLHGKPKTPTWTVLASTAAAGATQITLNTAVNWSVGDQIIIASTDFDPYQTEQRTITAI